MCVESAQMLNRFSCVPSKAGCYGLLRTGRQDTRGIVCFFVAYTSLKEPGYVMLDQVHSPSIACRGAV